ncbi:MAG: hypothetical protein WA021_01295 [Minisyncoccia bacterium]
MHTIIYWVVGVGVVAGGAWAFMGMPNLGIGADDFGRDSTGDTVRSETSNTGSLWERVADGSAWTCEYEMTTGNTITRSVMYIVDGKMRIDGATIIAGASAMETHMIMRDNVVYSWSNLSPQGVKIAFQAGGEGTAGIDAQAWGEVHRNFGSMCEQWNANDAMFALPAGVTFQ